MTPKTTAVPLFSELGIAPKLLAILEQQKFTKPTPIQHQCIPLALQGKDVVGIAQTGTGKTLAFGLPMIQRLAQEKGQGLILLPTRELALQVDEVLQKIGRSLGLRTVVLIGGESIKPQIQKLIRQPHVIVATPGRLIDHLQQKTVTLQNVKIIVLDEADRMLDIGFMPQIREILKQAPSERQTLMFSATMPGAITELAKKHMKAPLRIEVAPSGTPAENVEHEIFIINKEYKMPLLEKILAENPGTVLLFSRTKYGAKKITAVLRATGHSAAEIHSNRSLYQRKQAMLAIQQKRSSILVATDIAARGIDIPHLDVVINYDLPEQAEDYVHRIGRVGRAGRSGKAVSLVQVDQGDLLRRIQRFVTKPMQQVHLKTVQSPDLLQTLAQSGRRQFGGRKFGGGGGSRRGFHRRRFH